MGIFRRGPGGTRENKRRLTTLVSLVVLLMIAGIAFAAWVVNGSGQGAAQAGVVDDLVLTPGTPTDLLYPGGDPAGVAVTVFNPNTYPVTITAFFQSPSELITSDNTTCTTDIHGVTFTTANGIWELAAGETVAFTLAGAVSMAADSAKVCQGSIFTIPLTVTAQSGTAVVDADEDGVPVPDDCDDADPSIYPGAPEIAGDGIDQDCDGVDQASFDADGDGWTDAVDCAPVDASINPGATEVLDGVDNDCDGQIDEGGEFLDFDGDTFTIAAGDCDDTDATVNPAAAEVADGKDNDCDGTADEGFDTSDLDADGFTVAGGDCDDTDATVNPAAAEVADGKDNDCDGTVDE